MSKNVLSVENVTMQFGGVVAVDNLSLEVNEGEIVALIGPNGAGKTTAFNVITGVYAPTNGRVSFNGECIVRNHPAGKMKKTYKGEDPAMYTAQLAPEETMDDEALKAWKLAQKERDEYAFTDHVLAPTPDKITARGMARTFQNIRLWKTQTVFDNVLIAKHMRRSSGFFSATFRGNRKEEAKQREEVLELLRIVGLEDVKDELATSLPYGKQRRLEIARALATQPKLLLLDEPTNDLDVETLSSLEAALLEFPGCSVVISHDRMFLDRVATHILAWEGTDENPGNWYWFEGNFEAYQANRIERLGEDAAQPHRIHRKLTRD